MAGDLYHAVGEWLPSEPTDAQKKAKLSPGRVSHVFFFPKATAQKLEGKPKGWATSTNWGLNPGV